MFKFELGDAAKDMITGTEGILVSRIEHLNGCIRYELQPRKITDDGNTIELWIDEGQIKRTGPGLNKKEKAAPKKRPGGPRTAPLSTFHTPN